MPGSPFLWHTATSIKQQQLQPPLTYDSLQDKHDQFIPGRLNDMHSNNINCILSQQKAETHRPRVEPTSIASAAQSTAGASTCHRTKPPLQLVDIIDELPTHNDATCAANIAEKQQSSASSRSRTSKSACRTSSNLERYALAALERIFAGKKFDKIRPPWLCNPHTGRACELDLYNEELKIAVEVQGVQHYVYPNSWHKNRQEWEDLQYRDKLKEHLCKQAGVMLIHVPFTVQQKRVEQFICSELQRLGYYTSVPN
jgi:hypothetical protein